MLSPGAVGVKAAGLPGLASTAQLTRIRRDAWPPAEGSASPELPGEFCLFNLKFSWWVLDDSVCSGAVEF